MRYRTTPFGDDHLQLTRDDLERLLRGEMLRSGALRVSMEEDWWLTPEWCMDAFYRVNPGAASTMRGVPSLYLLDFAREVLSQLRAQHAPKSPSPPSNEP